MPYHIARGDGNCFYRCISQDIDGTEENHVNVRKKICATMKRHPHLYTGILFENQTFDQFIAYHSKVGNYADHEIVMAACEAYNINIIVYELNDAKTDLQIRFDLSKPNRGGFQDWMFANSTVEEKFSKIPTIKMIRIGKHYNLIPYVEPVDEKPRKIFRLSRNYRVNIAKLRQQQWQLNYDIYHANSENESVAQNSNGNSNIPKSSHSTHNNIKSDSDNKIAIKQDIKEDGIDLTIVQHDNKVSKDDKRRIKRDEKNEETNPKGSQRRKVKNKTQSSQNKAQSISLFDDDEFKDFIIENFGSLEQYKQVAISDNDDDNDANNGGSNDDINNTSDDLKLDLVDFNWYLGGMSFDESMYGDNDTVVCFNACDVDEMESNLLALPNLEDENGQVVCAPSTVPVYGGTKLKRPSKVAYKYYSNNNSNVEVRYQFLLEFKIYILGRFEENIPNISKTDIIREEFTFLYTQSPDERLSKTKIETIRGMIRRWKTKEVALKLNYAMRTKGIRIGGGGRDGKFTDIIEIMTMKECYNYIFNQKKISTLSIRLILKHMTAKFYSGDSEKDRLIPSIDEKDKGCKGYIFISKQDAISFKNKFNLKRQGDKRTYYDPAQAKDNQIPSLCLSMIYRKLIPIKFSCVCDCIIVYYVLCIVLFYASVTGTCQNFVCLCV